MLEALVVARLQGVKSGCPKTVLASALLGRAGELAKRSRQSVKTWATPNAPIESADRRDGKFKLAAVQAPAPAPRYASALAPLVSVAASSKRSTRLLSPSATQSRPLESTWTAAGNCMPSSPVPEPEL